MIKAEFEKKSDMYRVKVCGHAGFAPKGKDIVCSGVSSVVCGLAGFIDNNTEHIQEKRIKATDGNFELFCVGDEKIEAGIELVLISLMQIAEHYPKNVRVVKKWSDL